MSEQARPVVAGCGLTGMAISRQLSREGIHHALVGRPAPFGPPKLGESMNLEGSYLLQEIYPEYERFFLKKTKAITYIGEWVAHFDADKDILPVIGRFFGLDSVVHPTLLHLDRIGFDQALLEEVRASERCTLIEKGIAGFDYSEADDRVAAVRLEDGTRVPASFVFDASNHGRALARDAGIGCRFTSPPQRIVFTHYQHPDYELGKNGANPRREVWSDSTSVMVLRDDLDGIEGVAWFIPLGDYLSLGISMDEDANELDDAEVLSRLETALARRGMDFREIYPRRTRIASARNQYFIHDRAWGANWMLAGPTYAQIWFPSSSGVGMALFASLLATRFLRAPARTGRRYEAAMREFVTTHDGYRWLIGCPLEDVDQASFGRFSDKLISEALCRTAAQCGQISGVVRRQVLRAFRAVLRRLQLKPGTFMHVHHAPVEQLTPRLYGSETDPRYREVLQRLVQLLDGELDMSQAWDVLDRDVVIHVGPLAVSGIGHWFTWLRLVRRFSRVSELRLELERLRVDGDRVEVEARWRGRRRGRAVASNAATAVYRIRDGRIVEIWSRVDNYTFVFGGLTRSWPGALAFLLFGVSYLYARDLLRPIADPPWQRPAAPGPETRGEAASR